MIPLTDVRPNSWEFMDVPMILPTGFREYDMRWRFPDDINLAGFSLLGQGIGTQMRRLGVKPEIIIACDYREYSVSVRTALALGLMRAGTDVKSIGASVSPMAYFSRQHLGIDAVAMVTASHNPNGWTGVKTGFEHPLTHGEVEMKQLRDIVLGGLSESNASGGYEEIGGIRQAYLDDLCTGIRISRPIKAVCATGNGTASAFAPEALKRIGVEVVPLHNELDYSFPNYNPDPESMTMLRDMADTVRKSGADLAFGFDGDGDRLGIVDDECEEIFSDKLGVLLARELARSHRDSLFIADVKSTGIFATDAVLKKFGARSEFWKTGHSHIKRRVAETGALAGFEKSGHFYLAPPVGRGYDCALRVAVELCLLLDRHPDDKLSDMKKSLPRTYSTPTLSPPCPDTEKYGVVERVSAKLDEWRSSGRRFAGAQIEDLIKVNGVRVSLPHGSWGLIRASSNTPNLVVVCESTKGESENRLILSEIKELLRKESSVDIENLSL
ncbi:MAG: phosphomannomutase/phosphoglucomutase [Albidovulum sp.]|nr:phosphomannomutase/phosphoglucomutase [Albidovulum sp.]